MITHSTNPKSWKDISIALGFVFVILWFFIIRVQSNLKEQVSFIEIVILVFYPLIILYMKNGVPVYLWLLYMIVFMVFLIIIDPILHESSHILGLYAIGSKPIEFQLIPKFWEGEFSHGGWVRSEPVNNWLGPIPGLFPYLKDIVLIILGWFFLKMRRIYNAFITGFLYLFFCLSPTFDIVNNYSIKLIGKVNGNDFNGIALGWGEVGANSIGVIFSIIALSICLLLFVKHFPKISIAGLKVGEK